MPTGRRTRDGWCDNSNDFRRGAREAEGAPLLREYRVKSSIEGSNPSLSARHQKGPKGPFFMGSRQIRIDDGAGWSAASGANAGAREPFAPQAALALAARTRG